MPGALHLEPTECKFLLNTISYSIPKRMPDTQIAQKKQITEHSHSEAIISEQMSLNRKADQSNRLSQVPLIWKRKILFAQESHKINTNHWPTIRLNQGTKQWSTLPQWDTWLQHQWCQRKTPAFWPACHGEPLYDGPLSSPILLSQIIRLTINDISQGMLCTMQ